MASCFSATAKLPTFYIPHAVDVLSTGSYPRLPGIIRDKVIPPKNASKSERSAALLKLNEVIPSVLFELVLFCSTRFETIE